MLPILSVLTVCTPFLFTSTEFLDRGGLITVGDGVRSKGRLNGSTEAVFEQAIGMLPDGGTLFVLDGEWQFSKHVTIPTSRIAIHGSGASELRPAPSGAIGLFQIDGDGVRLSSLRVRAVAPTPSQSAIKVHGDDFTLDHCSLAALGPAVDFRLVDLGYDDGATFRDGAVIEANTFEFGAESAGVVGLRGRLGSGLRLIANDFGPEPGAPFGRCRYACEFLGEGRGTISANSFQNLGSPTDLMQAVIYSDSASEGHHFAIQGNFFEYCLAQRGIWLRGGRFCSIVGNVFGRFVATTLGVVRFDISSASTRGESNVVSANQFHNAGGPGVIVISQHGIVISGNSFTLASTRQIDLGANVFGSSITGNQFVKDASPTAVSEAIRIQTGGAHMVHDNSAFSDHPTVRFGTVLNASGVPVLQINAADNWLSP